MKKTALLHTALSEAIAGLGHGDLLVIGDAGLPCPPGPRRIDLALTRGVPSLLQVLHTVLQEMQVERAYLAGETETHSPAMAAAVASLLGDIPAETLSHEALKQRCVGARCFVRSGEATPYANIILSAGVVF